MTRIRRATLLDVPTLARHRVEMFRDMGEVEGAAVDELRRAAARYMDVALASGEYIGWLAVGDDDHDVRGGAGVQLRSILPRPVERERIILGPEALVLNVYTEHAWRRRGIARLLMEHVMTWAREARVDRLILHASPDGRTLYESLGFIATNEMRYPISR